MARNMHKYEELTPYEFDQEKKRASIIYAAAGPLEYHEECNALGIDMSGVLRQRKSPVGSFFP